MAWMRMMGAESVAYHRATVLGRVDDHPSQALAYYASRGETPLVWGGAGAVSLGLAGPVTDGAYEAVFGPGGARHPGTDKRLVSVRRPGMELVISAHKSVAELGVVGRAEDMHRIMDAERDATLAYLDQVTRTVGGRRGRASVQTPTGGLVYAHTRHATSRAGDPCPHDHVLLANVVEMLDERGGWKAANTSLWREHLHAATMAGRMAAARTAVELGYGIEADPGPSGRLGQWKIAGVPDEVMELHSKRAAEITAAVQARGEDTYQARQVAARATRKAKGRDSEGELVARWQAELAAIGWPPERLLGSIEAGSGARIAGRQSLKEARRVLAQVLADDGELARRKVFSRRDLLVEVAPHLYGWDPQLLELLVDRATADPAVIPAIRTPGALEPVYALASVLAREGAIADSLARHLDRTDAPAATPEATTEAIGRTEERLGSLLSDEQRRAAQTIATSGRGAELVVGVAGAGKTTMLAAVAAAFEASGCEVIGTATAGQAARTLGEGADLRQSSTLARLTGQLDRGGLRLGERSVVILDESGMTDDIDLARLLTHIGTSGGKVVMVGDHRQLGAVGPGGALAALVGRHPDTTHHLIENRRQSDPDERQALSQLRDGNVGVAVDWYSEHGRIRAVPSRSEALDAAVRAWAADQAAGADTALLAWRRVNVAELNARARDWMATTGRLSGPALIVGDLAYQAGDQIVALAPNYEAGLVTSQRGTITFVDPIDTSIRVEVDDGRTVTLIGDQLGGDRLGHGYATTVHRAQGATFDRTHLFVDGGGRELAYVAMSRARHTSTAWTVADNPDQATEDLRADWNTRRTPAWAIDTGLPDPTSLTPAAADTLTDDQKAEVVAIAHARAAQTSRTGRLPCGPPQPSLQYAEAVAAVTDTRQALDDLPTGTGVYRDTPVGHAANEAAKARRALDQTAWTAEHGQHRSDRRHAHHDLPEAIGTEAAASARLHALIGAERDRLETNLAQLTATVEGLYADHDRASIRWHQQDDQQAGAARTATTLDRHLHAVRSHLDQPSPPHTTGEQDRRYRRSSHVPEPPEQHTPQAPAM